MRSLSTMQVEDPRSAPFHLRPSGTHPGDTAFVEGLRMDPTRSPQENFNHVPVMLDEIVELFRNVPEGVVVDGTLGGAGHSEALLEAHARLSILGIDRDVAARDAASRVLGRFGDRARIAQGTFDQMVELAASTFPGHPIVGVLLDLGVSSHQIDSADRGFSYRRLGPLDMRMDQDSRTHAGDVVNSYAVEALTKVLREGGEEQFASRIARAIVAARPVENTGQLGDVVRDAVPAPARRRGDPAKRTFQALRLEVNEELPLLRRGLDAGIDSIRRGGRFVVLSYHSGEDRIVKHRFVESSTGGCICPPQLPCACGARPVARLLTRGARKPSADEVARNPRAMSARLRAIEITAEPTPSEDQQ